MEYEDTFPYEGTLVNLSAAHHYKKDELKQFLQVAAASGFEIMPLIPTLGQMQYVLKHEEFQHLRERSSCPERLCPSQEESIEVIKEMLTQLDNTSFYSWPALYSHFWLLNSNSKFTIRILMSCEFSEDSRSYLRVGQTVLGFHQSIAPLKHVHIDCNEISPLNLCAYCKQRNLSHADLFVNHVVKVAEMVKNVAPNATSLIWWDMFEPMNHTLSNYTERFYDTEVVYWCYTPEINIPFASLYNEYTKFSKAWMASAFKDEAKTILPNIVHRALSTLSWMKSVAHYNSENTNTKYQFKGIFLTSGSRRNHFEPVYNLLVPSIPSLLIDLTIINKFNNTYAIDDYIDYFRTINDVADHIKNALHCDRHIDFTNNLKSCTFEGYELYNIIYNYDEMMKGLNLNVKQIQPYLETRSFDKKDNSSVVTLKDWCEHEKEEMNELTEALKSSMAPYYEKKLIDEYIDCKSYELTDTIKRCGILCVLYVTEKTKFFQQNKQK